MKVVIGCCFVYIMFSVFQLFDTASLNHMKTFKTERPVNSAALSPLQEHVSANVLRQT